MNKKIRIPVPQNQFELWAKDSWIKPLRYFKMLLKEFTPVNKETEDFIISYITDNFDTIYMKTGKQHLPNIQFFLIRYVTGGEVLDDGSYYFGKQQNKLLPFLKEMSKHIDRSLMIRVINLFV